MSMLPKVLIADNIGQEYNPMKSNLTDHVSCVINAVIPLILLAVK